VFVKWLGYLSCLIFFNISLLYSNDSQAFCQKESEKTTPQVKLIQQHCYETGKAYESDANYKYASW